MANALSLLTTFVVSMLILMAYLLPTLVAVQRRHPDAESIALANLLLGWTLLGWGMALWRASQATAPIKRLWTPRASIDSHRRQVHLLEYLGAQGVLDAAQVGREKARIAGPSAAPELALAVAADRRR